MRDVAVDRRAQGTRDGFEDGFDLVMGIFAVENADMKVAAGVFREAVPEMPHHLGREVADRGAGEGYVEVEGEAACEVDHHAGQGLVHRHVSMAEAGDVGFVVERLGQGLPQGNADILGGCSKATI